MRNQQKLVLQRILLLVLLLIVTISSSSVESRNDITTIQSYICDSPTLSPNDPYIINANSLIDQVVRDVPADQSREVRMTSQYQGTVAFVGGFCSQEHYTNEECSECMSAARDDLYQICGPSIGAQIMLTICGIRYANSNFF